MIDDEYYENHPRERPPWDYPAARTNPFDWSETERQEFRGGLTIGLAAALIYFIATEEIAGAIILGICSAFMGGFLWFSFRQSSREKLARAWQMGFDQGWAQARETEEPPAD